MEPRAIGQKYGAKKIPFRARFHQALFAHQIMNCIMYGGGGDPNHILLANKARSGQTYCVAELFLQYHLKFGRMNALIITPMPTETMSQFTDDMFRKFGEFADTSVVEIRSGADLDMFRSAGDRNVVIVSKQLIDGYVGTQGIPDLIDMKPDLIVFDENHFHGTTGMSKQVLATYSAPHTTHVFLTATYAKPLCE